MGIPHPEQGRAMADDAEKSRHLVALLRDYATKPKQLRMAFLDAGIDVQTAFELVMACVGAGVASQFFGRYLRRQSPEIEAAIAKAADVKRIIDDIRQREGDLRVARLAERLNEMGIPAPRGGAWRGEQVYRVLKRSGEGQR